ncbi:MAG: hypothetical protein ACRDJW_15320 [Thermomicrobiales bacterium]
MTQRLSFAISTQASAWQALDWWREAGRVAGISALDLELSNVLRRYRLGIDSWRDALLRPKVASVWIRAHQIGARRNEKAEDAVDLSVICPPNRIVCVAHDAVANPAGSLDVAVASAARLRATLNPSTRVALAISPINPDGGREHLVRLQALRHQAAEWDVDLALDLTGKLDETWEAEAAMLRIAKRLAIIRLAYPPPTAPGSAQWKLVRRILSAGFDVEFSGVVALSPSLRPWRLAGAGDVALQLRQSVAELRSDFRAHSSSVYESTRRRGPG